MAHSTSSANTGGESKQSQSASEKEDDLYGMGYDMFPERRRARPFNLENFFFKYKNREHIEQYKCEKRLWQVIQKSPLVRIMISSLAKAGCPINFRRHLECEYCEPYVTGGYDALTNQVVLCYNTATNYGITESVLFHELIHMFDYCTNHVDFRNIDHLACTEVRAANLTYCNYLSAFLEGLVSRTELKKQQKACVFKKAVWSVTAARNVSNEEAEAAVKKVFKKCYKDLEPIGRNLKRSQTNCNLAYSEAFLLGIE